MQGKAWTNESAIDNGLETNAFVLITVPMNVVFNSCYMLMCLPTYIGCVICTGSLGWFWHIYPNSSSAFTPSLAQLRAFRAGGKRVGASSLAGISPQVSREMRGDRGRHLPAASGISGWGFHLLLPACYRATNSRKPPADCLAAWNLHGWVGDATPTHQTSKRAHMCTPMQVNM